MGRWIWFQLPSPDILAHLSKPFLSTPLLFLLPGGHRSLPDQPHTAAVCHSQVLLGGVCRGAVELQCWKYVKGKKKSFLKKPSLQGLKKICGDDCGWYGAEGAGAYDDPLLQHRHPFPNHCHFPSLPKQTQELLFPGHSTSQQGFILYLAPSSGKHLGQPTHMALSHTTPQLLALPQCPSHHQILLASIW